MALYEGIALIQEKQAVVLDLGADYTKFGFTGEAAPRCIVRSQYWDAATRAYKRVYDYDTPEQLYDNLVNMLHLLYFRHVLVNPKERKVVVVESLLTPTLFRETLARVLYTHYEVSGVIWADGARLCALTLGAHTVLVLDIGAREAEVTAVVHNCVVLQSAESQPVGARALHAALAHILREDNDETLHLADDVLEDIKVKTCFVTSRARALQWASSSPPAPAKSVRYPLRGRAAITVSGRARELPAEVMFSMEAELCSLADMVLRALLHAPRDARRALAAAVLVCGGGSELPGLRARLRDELHHRRAQEPYASRLFVSEFKFHSGPAHANSVSWAGGAALGAGAGGAARALPRDVYARSPRLRDWACLLDNTPPDHPHRRLADM